MTETIITAIITALCTGGLTWLFTLRYTRKQAEADAMKSVQEVNQHLNPLIGSNIRRLRKERHMKAVDVIAKLQCENINVTTGIFSKVENGYNNPTVDMLIALTKVFECDFNEFFKK